MKDYLSGLLGRAVEGSQTLRRRPMSRYEPTVGAPDAGGGWQGPRQEIPSEDSPEFAVPIAPPPRGERRAPVTAPITSRPADDDAPSSERAPGQAAETTRAVAFSSSDLLRNARKEPARAAEHSVQENIRASGEGSGERRPTLQRPTLPSPAAPLVERANPSAAVVPVATARAIAGSPVPGLRPLAPAPRRVRPDDTREGASRVRPAAQREASTPPPAPVIQVTIGRVEVRAAVAPSGGPAVRVPQPAARRLSLEQYLDSRQQGPGK